MKYINDDEEDEDRNNNNQVTSIKSMKIKIMKILITTMHWHKVH